MSLDYIEIIVMDRGEKLKVFFKMNERYYGLFNIIQMGVNGIIDLKITDYYNNLAIVAENIQDKEKGYLTEEENQDLSIRQKCHTTKMAVFCIN